MGSMIESSLSDLLLKEPLGVLEFIKLVGLPIDRVNCFINWIGHCGHLEGKDVIFELIIGFLDFVSFGIKEKCFI